MPFRDVVVLLPGISGSVLKKDGRTLWGADIGGILGAITSGGDTIRELTMRGVDDPSLDDIDGVTATCLIPDIHLIPGLWKIDGYTKVAKTLVDTLGLQRGQNFFEFPYDWRRDNRVAARKLGCFARDRLVRWKANGGPADAKLIFVAHSMGGLVARTFIEVLGGWEETRALYTLGTPFRGSMNALGYLCNGFAKGVGPLKLDLSDVLRSFTGVYQLLPTYACVTRAGGGEARHLWEVADLPHVDNTRAQAARTFHDELVNACAANAARPEYQAARSLAYPIIGTFQPTFQTAGLDGRTLTLKATMAGADDSGDGTVPAGSAMPRDLETSAVGMRAKQVHGSLQNDDAVLDHVLGSIRGQQINYGRYRADLAVPGLDFDDVYAANRTQQLRVTTAEAVPADLFADVVDARIPADTPNPRRLAELAFRPAADGAWRADFNLPAGVYRVSVKGANVRPAADCIVVADVA